MMSSFAAFDGGVWEGRVGGGRLVLQVSEERAHKLGWFDEGCWLSMSPAASMSSEEAEEGEEGAIRSRRDGMEERRL